MRQVPPPPGSDPIDLLGAESEFDPRFREVRRFIGVWEAFRALQYVIGGIVLLAVGFGVWRTAVPSAKGPAMTRAVQDGHDGMIWIFVGIGALVLLVGSFGLYWGLRQIREESDGKWG